MKLRILTAVAALALSVSARAVTLTSFDITWSGESLANSASAVGRLTIDTDTFPIVLPNPTVGQNLPNTAVTQLSLTISGATSGNGSYGLSNFDFLSFSAPTSLLDLTRELIGQSLGNDCFYGVLTSACSGKSGDFNIFGFAPAPRGVGFFTLAADFGTGDRMQVTSIRLAIDPPGSVVPEPATWAMMITGFGLVGFMLRRRRTDPIKIAA